MKINILWETLKYCDFFGTSFNFYTEKNRKYLTPLGGILTLLSCIFGVIIFIYINLDNFLHNLPNSTTSTERENHRLIKFKEEKIWIPWRISDCGGKTINHTNLFYPLIYYYSGKWNNELKSMITTYEFINYKLCNETSMVNYTDFYMIDVELDQLYCIDMEELTIGGSWDFNFLNLISLDIYACKNGIDYDEKNENCTTYEKYIEIIGKDNSFEFEMYYPVVHYQPINKTIPIFIEYSNYFYHLSRYSNKIDRIYLQQHILNDDRGLFFKNEKNYSRWGCSSLSGDSYIKGDKQDLLNEGSTSRFYSFNIYLNSDLVYYKRSYKKIFLIFANGLPIVNVVFIIFRIIAKIFKISSGNKKLTELLFENLKEKKTFFTKKIFSSDKNLIISKKTDKNYEMNNLDNSNNNLNNNSNILFFQNLNDFSCIQLNYQDLEKKHILEKNQNLVGKVKNKSKFIKTQINSQSNCKKHFNNIFVLGDHNYINNNINNNINNDINNNINNKEDDINKKSNDQSDSLSNNNRLKNNNSPKNRSYNNPTLNIKSKTHYIKKKLFPYKYYLCSIFIKNIDISKTSFFFTKKFIIVYNFISQLFDISSYLILQREFQTMKNTIIEESQRNIIEKGQKINVGANSFNMNMRQCLDHKKLSIFGKIKQTKDID